MKDTTTNVILIVVGLLVLVAVFTLPPLITDKSEHIDIDDRCYYEETENNRLFEQDTVTVEKVCVERSPA